MAWLWFKFESLIRILSDSLTLNQRIKFEPAGGGGLNLLNLVPAPSRCSLLNTSSDPSLGFQSADASKNQICFWDQNFIG